MGNNAGSKRNSISSEKKTKRVVKTPPTTALTTPTESNANGDFSLPRKLKRQTLPDFGRKSNARNRNNNAGSKRNSISSEKKTKRVVKTPPTTALTTPTESNANGDFS